MIIRRIRKGDFEGYYELEKEFAEVEKESAKKGDPLAKYYAEKKGSKKLAKTRFDGDLKRKNSMILVAEENGKIIGFFAGVINQMEHLDIKCGHIRDMIISKEYRRRGIATKFEKEFLKWIKTKGIKWATLNVAWHNDRARKAYEKWGFTNEDTWMIKRLK